MTKDNKLGKFNQKRNRFLLNSGFNDLANILNVRYRSSRFWKRLMDKSTCRGLIENSFRQKVRNFRCTSTE